MFSFSQRDKSSEKEYVFLFAVKLLETFNVPAVILVNGERRKQEGSMASHSFN